MEKRGILGRFFKGKIGINQVSNPIILQRAKKRNYNISKLRVLVGLFDQSVSVLEDVERIGEGEKRGGIGGEREELLQRNNVL